MVYAWGILASVLALISEITQKALGEYWTYWYWFIPIAIGINYSLFRIVQLTPNLLSAFILFSGCVFFGRMFWTVISNHPISIYMWVASGLYVIILLMREIGSKYQ